MRTLSFALIFVFQCTALFSQQIKKELTDADMQGIYEEIKTPYKYGLVLVPENDSKKIDSPSVFRKDNTWYMTYIVFDGKGYETWLAKSQNLLDWTTLGKVLSYGDSTHWDANQKAGYLSLCDYEWGGSYALQKYNNRYWMSYLGGSAKGYEAGKLAIGMAFTTSSPTNLQEWNVLPQPVLSPADPDVRWWETEKLYKSSIIWDRSKTLGHSFVMFYNAQEDAKTAHQWVERIGMAVSDDMVNWKRYHTDPVLDHHTGITGDAVIQKIGSVWVMFYFGAFWEGRKDAFNRFACSYDLVHWTDWKGADLIAPSEPYDNLYAHKSYVVKWKGVVYHFYNAVNTKEQRGIAVATSRDLGKSKISFNNGK